MPSTNTSAQRTAKQHMDAKEAKPLPKLNNRASSMHALVLVLRKGVVVKVSLVFGFSTDRRKNRKRLSDENYNFLKTKFLVSYQLSKISI